MSKKTLTIQLILGTLMLLIFSMLLAESHVADQTQFLYSVGALTQYTDSIDLSALYSADQSDIIAEGKKYIEQSEYSNTWSEYVNYTTVNIYIAIFSITMLLLAGILLLSIYERHKIGLLQKSLCYYFDNKQWRKTEHLEKWQTVFAAAEKAAAQQQSHIEKLEQEKEHLKDFAQNIYHQMKSPIAAASICIDLEIEKAEHNRPNLYRISGLLKKSNDMLTTLLRLGQFEAHVLHLTFDNYCIDNIICSVCEQVSDEINFDFTYDIISDEEISPQSGNTFWLTEGFLYLLSNACEYSSQSEPIKIIIMQGNGATSVTIQNRCPEGTSIPNTGRFETTSQNHFGIGLHLVEAIIKAHFGTISFSKKENLLLTTVVLPYLTGKEAYHA